MTGWFAPASLAGLSPASSSHVQLLLDLGASWEGAAKAGITATVGHGLHARLGRWLAARGVATAMRDAPMVEVRSASLALPLPGEVPVLERLVSAALEDPSGDVAAALAGLLIGAPWEEGDPFEPKQVGSKVTPRFSSAAGRGVARLIERHVLERSVTGTLDVVGECLSDPAIRPVLVMAVERALGHMDVFPVDARERAEHRLGRPWELAAGTPRAATLETVSRRFLAYARASGMAFELDLVRAFVVGLRAKPFAILTGVSGTGKTRLAQLFARFMTEALGPVMAAATVTLVPVKPDWLDSRGLLGYFNVLRGTGTYEDTAALRLMLHASEHPNEPHFLILDEMNLARVEHYLAEVLSAMESGAPIPLHGRPGGVPSVDGSRTIPPELVLSPNFFLVGTVNVDETTHAFSPKVLDRAWTWEFAPAALTTLLRDWLGDRRPVPPATDDERRAILEAGNDEDPMRSVVLAMGHDGVGQRVDRIFAAMASGGRPFGFRVATELLRFVHLCEREGIETPPAWWLDHAVLGKVLPRLSGARRDLEGVLRALLTACTPAATEGAYGDTGPRKGVGVAERETAAPRVEDLARTADKLRELLARLEREPFVTFTR